MAKLARVEYFVAADGGTIIQLIGANGEPMFRTETLAGVKGEAQVEHRVASIQAALDEAVVNGRIGRRE